VPFYFLKQLPIRERLTFYALVVREDNTLVDVVQDKVERGGSVQIPAEDSEKIKFASLHGVEPGVGSALSQARSRVLLGLQKAAFETVAH